MKDGDDGVLDAVDDHVAVRGPTSRNAQCKDSSFREDRKRKSQKRYLGHHHATLHHAHTHPFDQMDERTT